MATSNKNYRRALSSYVVSSMVYTIRNKQCRWWSSVKRKRMIEILASVAAVIFCLVIIFVFIIAGLSLLFENVSFLFVVNVTTLEIFYDYVSSLCRFGTIVIVRTGRGVTQEGSRGSLDVNKCVPGR